MKRLIIFLALALRLSAVAMSLPTDDAGKLTWQTYFELLVECEEEEAEDINLMYEVLSEIAANPINLNTVTAEQLEEWLCFSELQIEAIIDYVNHYGPLRSKGELLMIPTLDSARRGLLSTLTYLGEGKERNFLDSLRIQRGRKTRRTFFSSATPRSEVVAAATVPLYSRKGFDGEYGGGPVKHWLRVGHSIDRHMKVGFVASQDAGEPFLKGRNSFGYDFYSFYLRLQKFGMLKAGIVGRYRIRNALGLVLNNNMSFGKSFTLPATTSTTTLLPHSSKSEANYLQGIAATLTPARHLQTTLFASLRPIDATLTDDGSEIKTILRTGYHRTRSELLRKGNAQQATAGAAARMQIGRFAFGATGIWNRYSLPLKPYESSSSAAQLYRRFYPAGQTFWNVSIDYSWRWYKKLVFCGEIATDHQGSVATINTLSSRLSNKLSLNVVQRFFPMRFVATMGRSFSEGGMNQDESGVYVSATWTPSSRLSLTAYTDFAYFAWPKYQTYSESRSFDNLLQATYKLTANSSLNVRYRLKLRQKNAMLTNDINSATYLLYKNEQRLRIAHQWREGNWTLKSQVDLSFCKHAEQSCGMMLGETFSYKAKRYNLVAAAGYFHTRDYSSCIYVHETSAPYTLSFPAFYGEGLRAYAFAEVNPTKKLSLMAKTSFTRYFDRDTIGSGYQLINSNHMTDIELMLRWRM